MCHVEGIGVEKFEQLFLNENLCELFAETDVDMVVWKMNVKIGNVLNRLAPKRTATITRKHAPWIDEECKKHLNVRNGLHKTTCTINGHASYDL